METKTMRKFIVPFAAVALASNIAFAADHIKSSTNTAPNKQSQTQTPKKELDTVKLYQEASDTSNVLATINLEQRLVPFYKKGDWIKVGDPSNGQVGWINKEQYRNAMNNIVKQSVQTIYIEQNDENNGKPQITVYQNGQKVTGKQADEIYKQVQKQQENMQAHFMMMQKSMNNWMNQQMQMLNSPMTEFSNLPVLQPIIIVENKPDQKTVKSPSANNTKIVNQQK